MRDVTSECPENSGENESQGLLNPEWRLLILEPGIVPYKTVKEYLDHIASELLEASADSDYPTSAMVSGRLNKPEGFPSEAADLIILTLAMCLHNKVDIEEALRLKLEYLKRRQEDVDLKRSSGDTKQ